MIAALLEQRSAQGLLSPTLVERDITTDPDDAAITTAIIAMGHALGLTVVAEGVETDAHQALLRKQGCDEMQGYLFSRPMPASRFGEYLKESQARTGARRARGAA